ncbi:MAG: cysteine-rich CWC family protein [Hylemonella sp.]
MDTSVSQIDPMRCPLCGQPNACAHEIERVSGQPQAPCWCTRVGFDADLLARVPAQARGLACLCQQCASAPDLP